MSAFVLTNEGVVVNRTEAQLGKVPLAAWDLGTFKESRFLSMQPDPALDVKQGDACSEEFEGPWELSQGPLEDQVIAKTSASILGQVNRRAAAILAPLLKADIISTEIKSNQEADGRRCKVLYIYALLGEGGNSQVVREPRSINEMRAYIALLACTMKVLNAVEDDPNHETEGGPYNVNPEGVGDDPSLPWDKLPGAASWDFATGSIGNIVSKNLVNQLGSRTFACLRNSGAELSRSRAP